MDTSVDTKCKWVLYDPETDSYFERVRSSLVYFEFYFTNQLLVAKHFWAEGDAYRELNDLRVMARVSNQEIVERLTPRQIEITIKRLDN